MNEHNKAKSRREVQLYSHNECGKKEYNMAHSRCLLIHLSDTQWVCLVRSAGGHSSGGCTFINAFMYFCSPLSVQVLGARPSARAGDTVMNGTEAAPSSL